MIEELVRSADNLCASLEEASRNEKKFCDDVRCQFHKMNAENVKISTDLKQIKEHTT